MVIRAVSTEGKEYVVAPRTREQQDAYNEKRRRESAAKRGAPPPAPKGKAPAKKAKAQAKVNGHAPPKVKAKPLHAKEGRAKPVKSIPEHKIEDARTNMIQPKLATIQQTKLPGFTMAGSYVRKTGAGKGKLRNGTHQCTVAFTTEQMNWLVAKAGFKLVSLAEMIRICVVERMARPDGSST
jgi:hypothetical protein